MSMTYYEQLNRVVIRLKEAVLWMKNLNYQERHDLADQFCEEMIECFGEYEDGEWEEYEVGDLVRLIVRKAEADQASDSPIKELIKCSQDGCDEIAAARFTWPGRDEMFACILHTGSIQGAASAMGFHLQVVPLERLGEA